jgi:prepilin-type processing-associated H-X9-DG protein
MKRPCNTGFAAFTVIELVVIVGILVLLAFVVIPGAVQARQKAQRIRCVSYLKQIGLSFRIWSPDSSDKFVMARSTNDLGTLEVANDAWRTFREMSNELATPLILACLSDSRTPATDFATLKNANISYFIGLDADETMPELLLAGDSHLSTGRPTSNKVLTVQSNDVATWAGNRHQGGGNVALADGSVQQLSSAKLQEAVTNALRLNWETRTNATLHFAMPE